MALTARRPSRATVRTRAAADPPSPLDRARRFFSESDTRAKIQKLGTGMVASYGAVSNVTYAGGLAVAWIGFFKQTSLSPLSSWAAWGKLLAYYASFWVVQNFLRPARFGLAAAMAPAFDRLVDRLAARLGTTRAKAFGAYLALLGSTTMGLFVAAIMLACGPGAFRPCFFV
jgi:hypothetical protein